MCALQDLGCIVNGVYQQCQVVNGQATPAFGQCEIRRTMTKTFGTPVLAPGLSTTLTLRVEEGTPGWTARGLEVADVLPAGLLVSSPSVITSTCPGSPTIRAEPGSRRINLWGGRVPGATEDPTRPGTFLPGVCEFTVSVTAGNTPGTVVNTASSYSDNSVSIAHTQLIPGTFNPTGSFALNARATLIIGGGSIELSGGGAQSTRVGTAFAQRLQALVKDQNGNPVPNITVTFTAPGGGASGTFEAGVNTAVTGNDGIARSAVFTANLIPGAYTVEARVGAIGPANFQLTNLNVVQVTFGVNPPGGGVINPAGTVLFDQGALVPVTATANPGFSFAGFTGLLTGLPFTQTLNVNAAGGVIANFVVSDAYQIRYVANVNLGDSVINLTNTGASGAGLAAGTTAATTGAICVNVYAFSPDEQMVSCCSCPVTPNGLVSLSAQRDLVSNTLTPASPTSLVVKLLATVPVNNSCTGSATALSLGNLAPGLLAWGTTIKAPNTVVETPFLRGTLSLGGAGADIGELARLQQLCSFINSNGSGFGVCRSCRLGGLGGGRL
ncbi:MAG: Ig-like domain-containing protein [Bryobacteraceae bacterium]|nr:Ig-like domain-containing protein [Bryobacteraceae bacterium]